MNYLSILLLLFFLQSQVIAQVDTSTERILLDYILEKNPTIFDADTTRNPYCSYEMTDFGHSGSLMVLDSSKIGTEKLIQKIEYPLLSSFFPTTQFFFCRRYCNYEYDTQGLKTIYAIEGKDVKSIQNFVPLNYSNHQKEYVDFFGRIILLSNVEREDFSKAISMIFLLLHSDGVSFSKDGYNAYSCYTLDIEYDKLPNIEKTGVWENNVYTLTLLEPRLCIDDGSENQEESNFIVPYTIKFAFDDYKILSIGEIRR